MKVLTFSRFFPAYHPRKGEPTFFVEKILSGLYDRNSTSFSYEDMLAEQNKRLWDSSDREIIFDFFFSQKWDEIWNPKYHTIRSGNRWKVGDKFSPRVWSGKPYTSKQIEIAPPIEVKKVWDITFVQADKLLTVGDYTYYPNGYDGMIKLLAKNDGLSTEDLLSWFNKPFAGQIICWNENINY